MDAGYLMASVPVDLVVRLNIDTRAWRSASLQLPEDDITRATARRSVCMEEAASKSLPNLDSSVCARELDSSECDAEYHVLDRKIHITEDLFHTSVLLYRKESHIVYQEILMKNNTNHMNKSRFKTFVHNRRIIWKI